MKDRIITLILDEGKWLFASMLLSGIAVLVLVGWQRTQTSRPVQVVIVQAMNLFYGSMIGIMAFGHLLAVTVKLSQGTLQGSLWVLYPLGLVLAVPAWWLVSAARRLAGNEERLKRNIVVLNACLILALLALGFHNLPLAAPAVLGVAYLSYSKGAVGWTIAALTITTIMGLFIGSLVFMASGQSFEQFSGIE